MDESVSAQYDDFLLQDDTTLLYASGKYRDMLRAVLGSNDRYLVAFSAGGEIVGALPAFVSGKCEYGSVLNSLPFYGSNGGIVEHQGNMAVRKQLLASFSDLAAQEGCATTTLISSPIDPHAEAQSVHIARALTDQRIGQLKRLDLLGVNLDDALFGSYHKSRRTDIRKAQKLGVRVRAWSSVKTLEFLSDVHRQNMASIGGLPKPNSFFMSIPEFFLPDIDYTVWVATLDEQPIAALLVFYFNRTVEYFTPVTLDGFRELQPMQLLIHEALKDAAARGYTWWNFGGTWASQSGVYSFKSRWGAEDRPYTYYVTVRDSSILQFSKDELLVAFPHFFVVPFEALRTRQS